MAGFMGVRNLNRLSSKANLIRGKHATQSATGIYETPTPRAFWRPSRWLRGPSSLFWKRYQNPADAAGRFQLHGDSKRFSARAFVGKIPTFSRALYQRKELTRFSRGPLKWTPVPVVLGLFYFIYCQFLVQSSLKEDDRLVKSSSAEFEKPIKKRKQLPWHIPAVFYVYQFLPLRALSRTWGWLNDLYLPHWLRKPILSCYVWMFGVNLSEAAIQDLKWYKNLGEFFRRHLKPGVRPVCTNSPVVCPSDGTILHVGRVEDDCVEQVKGMTYSLAAFLGPQSWFDKNAAEETIVEDETMPEPSGGYRDNLTLNPRGTDLYHCVIYLAPGDYHRFHSPTEWMINFRRHFPGHLFSVSPSVTKRIEGLFNFNERVVYYGSWLHGFFSMAAVGATNVGSIRVYFDERLKTNNRRYKMGAYQDWNVAQHSQVAGIDMRKGDEFGEFNLGSTIVLLFEAPKGFRFNVEVGQKVLYGTSLGEVVDNDDSCYDSSGSE